eukprot:TRINITY_DN16232_c1_g3_i1.p1 TRINITY_DN16232_c1_g3~~TRINITY_DN16232_c1_g3_i1.p1  ORF type:complete len:619 (+),score=139.37 TRINITY_DN16232_c1_g3_i1:122-1858(+)
MWGGDGAVAALTGSHSFPSLPLRADVLLSNQIFEEELEGCLSLDVLRHLTGKDDPEDAEFLEMKVDSAGGSMQVEGIGSMLPRLRQLKLNHSRVPILRDLGTGLAGLRVLWLCRSELTDLSGITSLPLLEELYVSFNDIRDLAPLCSHEALQVLDLEGNLIEDIIEVQSLEAVSTLRELTLSLNPVCGGSEGVSRAVILDALPQLEVLDDVPRNADADAAGSLELDRALARDLGAELGLDREAPRGGPGAPWDECADFADADDAEDEGRNAPEAFRFAALSANVDDPLALVLEDADDDRGGFAARRRGSSGAGFGAGAGYPSATVPRGAGWRGAGDDAAVEEDVGASAAVAELRQRRAELRTAVAEGRSFGPARGWLDAEPNEQDLLLENVKRAPRPAPSVFDFQANSAKRPLTGFCPDRKGLRTAWSSSGSSTTYRPATSASTISALESEASDLTTGDDGAALAGSALAAARRRRKVAGANAAGGGAPDDGLGIRNLLRQTHVDADPDQVLARASVPDVRVGTGRLLTPAGRVATPMMARAMSRGGLRPSASPDASEKGPRTKPTYSTSVGEVLLLE